MCVPYAANVRALYMWSWLLAIGVLMLLFTNASSPIMGLLLGSNGLLCWFRNCPGYLLAPLNDFLYLVSGDSFVVKLYLVTSVGLVRVMWSRHSHQTTFSEYPEEELNMLYELYNEAQFETNDLVLEREVFDEHVKRRYPDWMWHQ